MKKSQKQIIVGKLRTEGFISRNWCLQHYISRLSAIIQNLEEEGWRFETSRKGGNYKTEADYVYTVVKSKYPKMEIVEVNGERIARMI